MPSSTDFNPLSDILGIGTGYTSRQRDNADEQRKHDRGLAETHQLESNRQQAAQAFFKYYQTQPEGTPTNRALMGFINTPEGQDVFHKHGIDADVISKFGELVQPKQQTMQPGNEIVQQNATGGFDSVHSTPFKPPNPVEAIQEKWAAHGWNSLSSGEQGVIMNADKMDPFKRAEQRQNPDPYTPTPPPGPAAPAPNGDTPAAPWGTPAPDKHAEAPPNEDPGLQDPTKAKKPAPDAVPPEASAPDFGVFDNWQKAAEAVKAKGQSGWVTLGGKRQWANFGGQTTTPMASPVPAGR